MTLQLIDSTRIDCLILFKRKRFNQLNRTRLVLVTAYVARYVKRVNHEPVASALPMLIACRPEDLRTCGLLSADSLLVYL